MYDKFYKYDYLKLELLLVLAIVCLEGSVYATFLSNHLILRCRFLRGFKPNSKST